MQIFSRAVIIHKLLYGIKAHYPNFPKCELFELNRRR
jgi:hypothetical protein